MKRYKSGDIVIVHFPFSDLKSRKVRPALVVVDQKDQDILAVPITSSELKDQKYFLINGHDYKYKSLPIASSVKYTKLFTLHQSLIHSKYTQLTAVSFKLVRQKIIEYIRGK